MSDPWRVYGPRASIGPTPGTLEYAQQHTVTQTITPKMWEDLLKRVEKLEKRVRELED